MPFLLLVAGVFFAGNGVGGVGGGGWVGGGVWGGILSSQDILRIEWKGQH